VAITRSSSREQSRGLSRPGKGTTVFVLCGFCFSHIGFEISLYLFAFNLGVRGERAMHS
jgi:hypothetical protein